MIKKMLNEIVWITISITSIISLIAFMFIDSTTVIYSGVIATLFSIMGLYLIAFSTINLKKSKWKSYGEYLFRIVLYGLSLVIAIYLKLNLVIFVLGLLSTKIAIVIYGLYKSRRKRWI